MNRIIKLATVLTFVFTVAACSSGGNDNASSKAVPSSESNPTELKITATSWEFDQPEYKIKQGEPVEFTLENDKGYHEVRIQGVGINLKDDEPQQFTFTEAGTYEMICSIQCGTGHNSMKAKLIVE